MAKISSSNERTTLMNDTTAEGDADEAARGWFAAMRLLLREMPMMSERPGRGGVVTFTTGIPLPTLNGVFTQTTDPDIAEVAASADGMKGLGVPWCIQLRGEPDAEVRRVASAHGLLREEVSPLMLYRGEPMLTARGAAGRSVRVMRPEEREGYAAALAAGFEAPLEIMAIFSSPELLAVPGAVPYVAESVGQIVAVGLGLSAGESIGVFNITTLPGHRGRGHGRAVTERIVADGIEQGATLAYLQSSKAGYDLYTSMGFRTVEKWTYLLPAE
jgi:ribosomal protein S18 acetylase RimI-like enzyme